MNQTTSLISVVHLPGKGYVELVEKTTKIFDQEQKETNLS